MLSSVMQALRAVGLARHPQIKLMHWAVASQLKPVRVEKIWSAFEYLHLSAGSRVQPCQRARYRCFALAGSRGSNQYGRTAVGGHRIHRSAKTRTYVRNDQ